MSGRKTFQKQKLAIQKRTTVTTEIKQKKKKKKNSSATEKEKSSSQSRVRNKKRKDIREFLNCLTSPHRQIATYHIVLPKKMWTKKLCNQIMSEITKSLTFVKFEQEYSREEVRLSLTC